jgi:hypothetical protein
MVAMVVPNAVVCAQQQRNGEQKFKLKLYQALRILHAFTVTCRLYHSTYKLLATDHSNTVDRNKEKTDRQARPVPV